ncbi:MAG: T9SS type A sorting domain-containing protein [Flavobacteriales bacterium]
MKWALSIVTILLANSVLSQKYLSVSLTPESGPDSCDAIVNIVPHNMPGPFQINVATDAGYVGFGPIIHGFCSGDRIEIMVFDSNCVKHFAVFTLASYGTSQFMPDSILYVMPSAPGMCDGALEFQFNNIPPNLNRDLYFATGGVSLYGGPIDSSFTGLCEGTYVYSFMDPNNNNNTVASISMTISYSTPLPCDHYNFDILKSMAPACDGHIELIPTMGAITDYHYYINYINPISMGGGIFTVNSNYNNNYVDSACAGPYLLFVEPTYTNNYVLQPYPFYVDSLIGDSSWNVPPILPANVDTISLPSLYNCNIDYGMPIDTVYLGTLNAIGGNYYEFFVYVIQGIDTIMLSETAQLDTTASFFVDLTIYCGDSSMLARSGGVGFITSEHMIYMGDSGSSSIANMNADGFTVTISPNPSSETVTISSSVILSHVRVYSMDGKLVLSERLNSSSGNNTFSIRHLASDLYIVKIQDIDKRVVTKKLTIIK